MTMFLVSSVCVLPPSSLTSTWPGATMRPAPWNVSILFFLNRNSTPFTLLSTILLLVVEQSRQIEARLADLDAELREAVAGFLVELGGVQQRLRGNAADVEAGAAEGARFSTHGDLQAKLRRANGADIAAGTGTDDDEIVGMTITC